MTTTANNIPSLRFPEYTGVWQGAKLGDVATFSKGRGISKGDIEPDGATPCIRYGELYTTYGTRIDDPVSSTNLDPNDLLMSEGGEVLVPASGESALDIARASTVTSQGIALGGDLNVISTELDSYFLAAQLSGKRCKDLAKVAQGNSVVHIYPSQLRSISVSFPAYEEQQKISSFLSAIDDRITQLERKKGLLTQYKKGCMQQLFSQQVRFTRDDGSDFPDWKWKTLANVGERSTRKNTTFAHERILTNSAIKGVVYQSDYFDNEVAKAGNIDGYYIVEKGDFVYNPRVSATAPVGPIKRNNLETGVMSPLYVIFKIPDDVAPFYEQYFDSSAWHRYMKRVANVGARHDRMAISSKDFEGLPLPCPTPEERIRITDFLSGIERRVRLLDKQIENEEKFKKGLLQQMFV